MDYILQKKKKGCIFCIKPKQGEDEKNLILWRGNYTFVIMNKFPYNNGHLMVVPKRHCIELDQLGDEEIHELSSVLKASLKVLKGCLHPHGFNLGMNIGKAGGAGEEHIHFHILPRWAGDTNFMPVLSETKIIPEYLDRTYQKLRTAFKNLSDEKRGRKGGRKR
jgi:ATP adenylyltransferase